MNYKTLNIDKGLIFGLVAIILWSTAASAFKIALAQFTTFQVLLISTLISTIVFLIYNILKGSFINFKIANDINFTLLKLSFLNPFLYYLLLFQAYSVLPAQLALTLNYLWPIILILLFIINKRVKYEKHTLFSLLISFIGFLILSSKGEIPSLNFQEFDLKYLTGIIFALSSAFVWAYYWLLSSQKNDMQKMNNQQDTSLFINFLISLVLLFIFGFLFKYNEISELLNMNFKDNITQNSLYASVYIGCFEMGFTFILWKYAISKTKSPEILSNLVYISPILSLIWISLLLKEQIYLTTYMGFLLILIGIFFKQLFNRLINKLYFRNVNKIS